jgi:hypothetical protein
MASATEAQIEPMNGTRRVVRRSLHAPRDLTGQVDEIAR